MKNLTSILSEIDAKPEVFAATLSKLGARKQIEKTIEELAEFTKILARVLYSDDASSAYANSAYFELNDETADVLVMIEQLLNAGVLSEVEVATRVNFKLDRLEKRLAIVT